MTDKHKTRNYVAKYSVHKTGSGTHQNRSKDVSTGKSRKVKHKNQDN